MINCTIYYMRIFKCYILQASHSNAFDILELDQFDRITCFI